MVSPVTKFQISAFSELFIISLMLVCGFSFASNVSATCHKNLNNPLSSCSAYSSQSFMNTRNENISYVSNKTKTIFNSECLNHQFCYDDSVRTKKSCDEEFINDIKYQCKVNFGRLYIAKQIPKRVRKCLKTVKKACANFSNNCGRTCLVYGSDNIAVQQVTQYIKNPLRADYLLPGAVFYPNSYYAACLTVVQGYQSAVSQQKNHLTKSNNGYIAKNTGNNLITNCP